MRSSWRTILVAVFGLGLSTCASIQRIGPVGGPGGDAFDDSELPGIQKDTRLAELTLGPTVCATPNPLARVIRYIQNQYSDPSGNTFLGDKHGTSESCSPDLFHFEFSKQLDPGEFVVGLSGTEGAYIDSITLITNRRTIGSVGGTGGHPFFLLAPPGFKVRMFFGRSAKVLDAIGIIAEEEPALKGFVGPPDYHLGASGGWDGNPFEDPAPNTRNTRVTRITTTSSCYVHSVELGYSDGTPATKHGGGGVLCPGFGGYIVAPQTTTLGADEFIVGVRGRAGKYVDRIEFVTNKRTIGPFGGQGGEPFSLVAADGYEVRRLFGRSGSVLDAIGIVAEKR